MKLDDFVTYVEQNLQKFKEDWLKFNKDWPNDWPLDGLNLADWLEQFEMMAEFDDEGNRK